MANDTEVLEVENETVDQPVVDVIDSPEPSEETATETPKQIHSSAIGDAIRSKLKADQEQKTEDKPEATGKKTKAKKKQDAAHEDYDVDPIKVAEAQGREQGRAIGDRIAESLKTQKRNDPPPEVSLPSDEEIAQSFPEEYRQDIAIYSEMKRMFPEKHSKIIVKLAEAAKKEANYTKAWQDENPESTYNPYEDDHKSFYDKTFQDIPDRDDRDFEAAKTSLNNAAMEARIDAKYRNEIEQLKMDRKGESIAPVIQQRVGDIIESALGAIDKKLTAIARNPAKLQALSETNPIAAEVVLSVHQAFSPLMAANIAIHQGTTKVDPQNRAHIELFKIAKDVEERTAAAPVEQRIDSNGREFATRSQYNKMTAEQQSRHWYVDQDVLSYILAQKAANQSKQWFDATLAKHQKWAKASGLKTSNASTSTQSEETEDDVPTVPKAIRNQSPPVPGRGQVPSPWSDSADEPKTGGQYFLRSLRGR